MVPILAATTGATNRALSVGYLPSPAVTPLTDANAAPRAGGKGVEARKREGRGDSPVVGHSRTWSVTEGPDPSPPSSRLAECDHRCLPERVTTAGWPCRFRMDRRGTRTWSRRPGLHSSRSPELGRG